MTAAAVSARGDTRTGTSKFADCQLANPFSSEKWWAEIRMWFRM